MGLKEVQGSWRVAAEVNYFCGFYDCPPVVEKDYSVGFQMAVEANPGSTESVAVWAVFGGGGAVLEWVSPFCVAFLLSLHCGGPFLCCASLQRQTYSNQTIQCL